MIPPRKRYGRKEGRLTWLGLRSVDHCFCPPDSPSHLLTSIFSSRLLSFPYQSPHNIMDSSVKIERPYLAIGIGAQFQWDNSSPSRRSQLLRRLSLSETVQGELDETEAWEGEGLTVSRLGTGVIPSAQPQTCAGILPQRRQRCRTDGTWLGSRGYHHPPPRKCTFGL